jgi:hypothetical protein
MQNPAPKEGKKNNLRELKESGQPSKAPPDTYMLKGKNFHEKKPKQILHKIPEENYRGKTYLPYNHGILVGSFPTLLCIDT